MKQVILMWGILAFGSVAWAHSWKEGEPMVFNEELRAHLLEEWQAEHGPKQSATPKLVANGVTPGVGKAPAQAAPFVAFAPKVEVKWDDRFLYIESNGLPAHQMMVGITTWQQQVPLPQAYFGDNAWRIPLKPVPAKTPQVVENHFLRGAIAIAVNGIPIFNPQNNRGEVAHEIGELDQWGGHCGRADDYHYHIAPLHLQTAVGKGMPIAYALDGYPIYGLTEPDGSPVGALDGCHGHEGGEIGYHYHASLKRPYVQSAFHGEVKETEGQVDPQPRANPVRPSLQALRGAKITGFESRANDSFTLSYEVNGEKRSVSYTIKGSGTYAFQFDNGREGVTEETYMAGGGGGGRSGRGVPGGAQPQGGPEDRGKWGGKGEREGAGDMRPPLPGAGPSAPGLVEGLVDVNGDGMITAQEFAESAKVVAARKGVPLAAALAAAREQFGAADHDRNGHLDRAEYEELTGAAPSRGGSGETRMRRESEERPPQGGEGRGGGGGKGGKGAFVEREDQPRSSDGKFLLTSPVMEDMTEMPVEYTGDGEAATLPLAWRSAPAGTQGYALIMDHAAPGGDMKWYWTLHDLPKDLTALPRNVKNVGRVGTGFRGQVGYEPPHSKGPGAKVYVITLYALSAPVEVGGAPGRSELLAAMKGKVLASSSLRVIHTSGGAGGAGSGERPRGGAMSEAPRAGVERGEGGPVAASSRSTAPPTARATDKDESGNLRPLDNIFAPAGGSAGGAAMAEGGSAGERPAEPVPTRGEGKGKGGPPGLVKPSLEDTTRLNVYADNWFMLYLNGRLVAVDPIPFTPHNVVSVDFLPEYPMTIAVLAKDNADPGTGMEYGTSIGDGGFILKFADGTVTNANWKAKSFFHGPVKGDTADPKVVQEPLPAQWWAANFDDSTWRPAKEYTEEQVDPKQPYFDSDFAGARFIWTEDLALDNTVIFRTKVDRPGWTPRWNTKPDLDVTGAPLN